ncbi:AbrB/MazE/SpoVT family DNA-binding domain-containing protein [Candidatus Woesearchaeota archaeon]|nr:AbrB/MazE/SpoVT family DNA-binding domain-containing protein [Candidatus Woesearchaeota archaeon]
MVTCTIRKWGNSMGVIIPKEVSLQLGLKPEDKVMVRIEKKENPLKEAFGALSFSKPTMQLLREIRKELEGDRI